jgi:hypothetical protein
MKAHRVPIIVAGLIIIALNMIVWAYDDELPIKIGTVEPASGVPGGLVDITAHVKRDLTRHCTLHLSRRLFSPSGFYTDMKDEDTFTPKDIIGLERRSPNLLKVTVAIPYGIGPGKYELVSSLKYSCNPWQYFFPIEGESILPFDVESAK